MRRGIVVTALLGVAACGTSGPSSVTAADPSLQPYAGPLTVPVSDGSVSARSGAAGQALECDGKPYAGGSGEYDSGLASVQGSAEDAVDNYFTEEFLLQLPHDGYRIERTENSRVLFSYDVDGRSKITLIAADDIRDFNDDRGWGIETWAACDPSELPPPVTDALGIEVWEDSSGHRAPITTIQSFRGPQHCDWQDMTFLHLGQGKDTPEYVRDPSGELDDYTTTTYAGSTALPEGATDTGFSREGRRLWVNASGSAAYLVKQSDPSDVERWPAAKQHIGCA